MSAPALPRRVPGAVLAASAAEDCSADSVFVQANPLVTGEPVCFECELEPAAFVLTMATPTFSGGVLTKSTNIGARCVGQVARDLPRDVDVVITRLRKDPS